MNKFHHNHHNQLSLAQFNVTIFGGRLVGNRFLVIGDPFLVQEFLVPRAIRSSGGNLVGNRFLVIGDPFLVQEYLVPRVIRSSGGARS
jgi:hypothetical protein